VFSSIRKHPVSEGFLVSGILIPLVLPATTPLWQVGVATAIAVILGKEVFGGTGFNILNPALTARAVLFFAYPGSMAGSQGLWVDLADKTPVDGFTGATVLDLAATGEPIVGLSGNPLSFTDLFMGWIPGSMGETSTLMCLIGAAILVITGVGSLRMMLSMVVGGLFMGYTLSAFGSTYFADPYMHIVAGGFAFGAVFMVTDPVSAAQTSTGKIIYGFLAGLLSILIRVTNPAFPEGVMLGILLANVLAPLIDYYVVQSNKTRRLKRATV
jgi:Na+-transporting NADH:ubiquinone oxidoreductase subunit B